MSTTYAKANESVKAFLASNGFTDTAAWDSYSTSTFKRLFTRGKRVKREGEPKKPLCAYFLYSADKRQKVKEENEGLNTKEIASLLGEMWKKEDKDVVELYKAKEKVLKDKYNSEMEDFIAIHGPAPKAERIYKEPKTSKPKRKKDPKEPKGPKTAYNIFCSEYKEKLLAKNKDITKDEIKERIKSRWVEVKDPKTPKDVKLLEHLKEKVEEDKQRYQNAMDIFNVMKEVREEDNSSAYDNDDQSEAPTEATEFTEAATEFETDAESDTEDVESVDPATLSDLELLRYVINNTAEALGQKALREKIAKEYNRTFDKKAMSDLIKQYNDE